MFVDSSMSCSAIVQRREHSKDGSSAWLPLLGSSWSRKTGSFSDRRMEMLSLRSTWAMRLNVSGKSLRILFQYPIPPFGHPMQLLLRYPSLYIAGSSMPALCIIAMQSSLVRL